MDQSRRADLKAIAERLRTKKMQVTTRKEIVGRNPFTGQPLINLVQEEYYDLKLDLWGKKKAAKAKAKIIAQLKDKKLLRLRETLIRAVKARDKAAEVRISARIKAHMGERFENYS